jgi:hypothetical protein
MNLLSEQRDCKRETKLESYVSYLRDNNVESVDTAREWRYFDKCLLHVVLAARVTALWNFRSASLA